ncbi:MAG: hypothetical protein O3A34_04330 [Actinomycetota bacterium]|nr:hypothetical protein [Actinomycetota bacterium]
MIVLVEQFVAGSQTPHQERRRCGQLFLLTVESRSFGLDVVNEALHRIGVRGTNVCCSRAKVGALHGVRQRAAATQNARQTARRTTGHKRPTGRTHKVGLHDCKLFLQLKNPHFGLGDLGFNGIFVGKGVGVLFTQLVCLAGQAL